MNKVEIRELISKNGKKLDYQDFYWDDKTATFTCNMSNLNVDFKNINGVVITVGNNCFVHCGHNSRISAGINCKIKVGNDSRVMAGGGSEIHLARRCYAMNGKMTMERA